AAGRQPRARIVGNGSQYRDDGAHISGEWSVVSRYVAVWRAREIGASCLKTFIACCPVIITKCAVSEVRQCIPVASLRCGTGILACVVFASLEPKTTQAGMPGRNACATSCSHGAPAGLTEMPGSKKIRVLRPVQARRAIDRTSGHECNRPFFTEIGRAH